MNLKRAISMLFLVASLTACGFVCGCKDAKSTASIGKKTWIIEIADTDAKKYAGLSGRFEILPDEGMLFIEQKPAIMRFCMRDCNVPIDIIFIDAEGRVVNTYEMKVEPDRKGMITYSSEVLAQYALEVAGGSVQKYGIKHGDRVHIKIVQEE